LDSTLALLVTVRAYDILQKPKENIIAVTMPCFGTSTRTKTNAHRLCKALGIPCREIDISETVRQHFRDINHSETTHDTTYENVQARMRTIVLMNLANQNKGIVIGSGSLSELALGWATYNGDHMSMYAVNSGVPKTLVREIVKHAGRTPELKSVLDDILNTPVSPELLPPENGEITQQTENILGSYELHDFFIYHALRWGRTPSQILELACIAFNEYTRDEIKKTLELFFNRFFSQQFKRSCLPDGVRVSEISLSPRGGWRMPSDTAGGEWLRGI
jgi:NAD+ synthase (glutamine-hydrolysing)